MTTLSNTKKNKFEECPARYDLYYNKKIRSVYLPSSLFFGVAIDEALNTMLLNLKEYTENPYNVFYRNLTNAKHNGEVVNPEEYKYTVFSKSDVDLSLTDCEEDDADFVEEFQAKKSKDWKRYNKLAVKSLAAKGKLILEAYEREVIPLIDEVKTVQESFSLANPDGDAIVGVIDFIASFKDEPGVFYIVDNKTASKAYTTKDIEESAQLHLYAYEKQIENIAYVVCEKAIRKKEPRVRITVMKHKASPEFTDKVLDDYENTLLKIREGKFEKNVSSGCKFYGRKCEYWSICFENSFGDKLVNLGDAALELTEEDSI